MSFSFEPSISKFGDFIMTPTIRLPKLTYAESLAFKKFKKENDKREALLEKDLYNNYDELKTQFSNWILLDQPTEKMPEDWMKAYSFGQYCNYNFPFRGRTLAESIEGLLYSGIVKWKRLVNGNYNSSKTPVENWQKFYEVLEKDSDEMEIKPGYDY